MEAGVRILEDRRRLYLAGDTSDLGQRSHPARVADSPIISFLRRVPLCKHYSTHKLHLQRHATTPVDGD
jgi:hypothetical protein